MRVNHQGHKPTGCRCVNNLFGVFPAPQKHEEKNYYFTIPMKKQRNDNSSSIVIVDSEEEQEDTTILIKDDGEGHYLKRKKQGKQVISLDCMNDIFQLDDDDYDDDDASFVIDLTTGASEITQPPIPIPIPIEIIDLKDYNSDGEEIWIERDCCICFEQVTRAERDTPTLPYFSYPDCKHVYCADCLSSWISSVVSSESLQFPLKCAVPDCQSTLAPCRKLKTCLMMNLDLGIGEGEHIFGRFVEKYIIATTDSMFCPNKTCSCMISASLVDIEAEERLKQKPNNQSTSNTNGSSSSASSASSSSASSASASSSLSQNSLGQCYSCGTKVCYSCKSADHSPLTCDQYQKIPMSCRKPEDFSLFKIIGEKKWSHCPSCKVVVEKVAGCNHIKCRCGTCFCYKCGNRYLTKAEEKSKANKSIAGPRNTHGYPTCKCNLFEPVVAGPQAPAVAVQVQQRARQAIRRYRRRGRGQ